MRKHVIKMIKVALILLFVLNVQSFSIRPNIVIFLADDMGRNDVSYHGSSQIPTPNIDALAYNGQILNRHYTMHICTPSRSALLTGNYPIRAGMQGFPLRAGEPRSLPIHMATIAERLKTLGYNTHLVGKWHLGHQNRSVTPNGRGFQTHLGYWSGFCGYFDYEIYEGIFNGFDLHRDNSTAFEYSGTYATDLFTQEASSIIHHHSFTKPLFLLMSHLAPHTGKTGWDLEVPNPAEADTKFNYISEPKRRLYAEMVTRLDASVGQVVDALSKKGILHNSILLFLSDNGAQTSGFFENFGSNWPFRGLKFTLFEGGVRNIAAIWSKKLRNKHYIENTVFHITDWLPTLYSAAGGDVTKLGKIDGINHWPLLSQRQKTNRTDDILLNIDEVENYSAIMTPDGRFKLTQGTYQKGIYDAYFGDSGRSNNTPKYDISSVLNSQVNRAIKKTFLRSRLTEKIITSMRSNLEIHQLDAKRENLTCNTKYCLFDLQNDPTETTNIFDSNSEMAQKLILSLEELRKQLVPQTNKPVDPNSNPALCSDSWFTWLDPTEKCTVQIKSV